jgi:hypothetical protein
MVFSKTPEVHYIRAEASRSSGRFSLANRVLISGRPVHPWARGAGFPVLSHAFVFWLVPMATKQLFEATSTSFMKYISP